MTGSSNNPASAGQAAHLVLYDGVCGLCSRLIQFVVAHDRRAVFVFASLQSAVGRAAVERFGADPNTLVSFYVLASYRTDHAQIFSRSSAALFVAGQLGWPWKAALVARVLPTGILDRVYDVVARNRYRVYGRFEQCWIPRPELRGRFVE
jgi:predicted DCC family thiol-disulfide oxidoreductase YuxK